LVARAYLLRHGVNQRLFILIKCVFHIRRSQRRKKIENSLELGRPRRLKENVEALKRDRQSSRISIQLTKWAEVYATRAEADGSR
jgi:hypothetical protein